MPGQIANPDRWGDGGFLPAEVELLVARKLDAKHTAYHSVWPVWHRWRLKRGLNSLSASVNSILVVPSRAFLVGKILHNVTYSRKINLHHVQLKLIKQLKLSTGKTNTNIFTLVIIIIVKLFD